MQDLPAKGVIHETLLGRRRGEFEPGLGLDSATRVTACRAHHGGILAAAWLAHLIAGRLVRRLRLVATAGASGPENAK